MDGMIRSMTDELDQNAYYHWLVIDERTGKRRRSTYKMQPAVALERFPGARLRSWRRERRERAKARAPGQSGIGSLASRNSARGGTRCYAGNCARA